MASTLKFLNVRKINSTVILPFFIIYLFSCLYRGDGDDDDDDNFKKPSTALMNLFGFPEF